MFDGAPWFFVVIAGFIALGFVAILGTIVWKTVSTLTKPRQTVQATCVGKRQSQSSGTPATGDSPGTSGSSWYYATFELIDGTRMELHCSGRDYGMLVEGDRGPLTYQGDVLRSFSRGTAVGRD
jgi:hypothetical protein